MDIRSDDHCPGSRAWRSKIGDLEGEIDNYLSGDPSKARTKMKWRIFFCARRNQPPGATAAIMGQNGEIYARVLKGENFAELGCRHSDAPDGLAAMWCTMDRLPSIVKRSAGRRGAHPAKPERFSHRQTGFEKRWWRCAAASPANAARHILIS